jgi:hypothetical protein
MRRVEAQDQKSDQDFQDDMWSFFQHCWHLKDWVKNDDTVPQAARDQVVAEAHASQILMVCRDLACGTKHLKLDDPKANAVHSHINITLTTGQKPAMEMEVEVNGMMCSGLKIARECVAEWQRILLLAGLLP